MLVRVLFFLTVALLNTTSTRANVCISPLSLTQSTVSVVRHFTPQETKQTRTEWINFTGWFVDSGTQLVTVAHSVSAVNNVGVLSPGWTKVEIRQQITPDGWTIAVDTHLRLLRIIDRPGEKLLVLELRKRYPGALAVPIRTTPLELDEEISSLGYSNGNLHVVTGIFHTYRSVTYDDPVTDALVRGLASAETQEKGFRLGLDLGASGGPFFDCKGRVVGVLSAVLFKEIQHNNGVERVSTALGAPNNLLVPLWSPNFSLSLARGGKLE